MRRRLTTLVLVVAAAGLGVAIVVDAVRGGGDGTTKRIRPEAGAVAEDLVGPLSPEPGALPGQLVVLRGERCVLQVADLARLRLDKPGPATGCVLALSPDGATAGVASVSTRDRQIVRLVGAELEGRPEVTRDFGRGLAPAVWSPDSARIAMCTGASSTRVLDVASGEPFAVEGCPAVFGPDGEVLSLRPESDSAPGAILRDGELLYDAAALGEQVGSPVTLRALAVAPDGTLAVLARFRLEGNLPPIVLVLREGALADVIPIRVPAEFGEEVLTSGALRFSPDGRELAVVSGVSGRLQLYDIRNGSVALGPIAQRSFDWSPDGAWLAIAGGDRIDVYGLVRSAGVAYSIPLPVRALAWRAAPDG